MSVSVDLATPGDSDLLFALWQEYMQELAEFRDYLVKVEGQYRDDRLRTYLAYEDHWAFIIRNYEEIVGFALVRKSKPQTHLIGEFFIKPEFRSIGHGALAVEQILQKFIGNWEIPFQEENPRAARFWRKTISELGFIVSEDRLPVAGKPDQPADVWLYFSNSLDR